MPRLLPATFLAVNLGSGGTPIMEIPATVIDRQRPWIIVAAPDGSLARSAETFGTAMTLRSIGQPEADA